MREGPVGRAVPREPLPEVRASRAMWRDSKSSENDKLKPRGKSAFQETWC